MSILHFIKKQDLEPNYTPSVNDYLISKKNYEKTAGCIALKKNKLKKLIKIINKKTKIIIT